MFTTRRKKTWFALGFLLLLTLGTTYYFLWLFGKTPSYTKAINRLEVIQQMQKATINKEGEIHDMYFNSSNKTIDIESEVVSFRVNFDEVRKDDFKVFLKSHSSPFSTIKYKYHFYPQISEKVLSKEDKQLLEKIGIPSLDEFMKVNPQTLPLNKLKVYEVAKERDEMSNVTLRIDSLLYEDYQNFLKNIEVE